jgi:hypothetical protein
MTQVGSSHSVHPAGANDLEAGHTPELLVLSSLFCFNFYLENWMSLVKQAKENWAFFLLIVREVFPDRSFGKCREVQINGSLSTALVGGVFQCISVLGRGS